MAKDVQHFAEMVAEYRGTARQILKRAYQEKIKEINAKYDAQIDLDDREARDRRRDAIAMFEAFLLKYPNDKRWTPDAMFRLAELYYEKSAEEYLDADEAYKKAIDSPNPPTTPPPRVDYTPTIDLYRRLLTEFPNYRFLDATYYLLGFCLGEMGEDAQARQALLALVCANKYKPLDPPAPPPPPAPVRVATKGSSPPTCRWTTRLTRAASRSQGLEVPARGVDPRRRVPLRPAERAGARHRRLPRVLTFKDSPYYDRALYKLAWSYYRDNRFPEAVREFDNLVRFADARKEAGQKVGSDLPPRGGAVPRRQLRRARLGRRQRSPIRYRPAARARLLQGARGRDARARGLPAAGRHLLRPDEVRRRDRGLQDAARRSGRTTPTRPRCRTGSSTPTSGPEPGRGRQGARGAGPQLHQGQRLVPAQTRTTPRRWRPRRNWPRTRC